MSTREVDKLGSSHQQSHNVWRIPQARLSFLIRSTYDTLPSPRNLHLWYGSEANCHLCDTQNPSLQHILTGCKSALTRYRWRYDQVLRKLAEGPGRRRHSGSWLRRQSKEASGFGSEGKTQRGASKDLRETSLSLPHHLEMFWDQRGETSVMGGSQLTTLQLARWHRRRCDRQQCHAEPAVMPHVSLLGPRLITDRVSHAKILVRCLPVSLASKLYTAHNDQVAPVSTL
ncbi:hypothetical protein SKAU_G00322500 [Synaphobranchus kaupii]|uniref:Reverse transcriptase zinc-binding domain-containing protein n=1 Tax=Synaphobranchus kaupii TaxID=118154 RepID=A0A9Q1EP28_SYNKA|nr:hypothetical protein SKAU_G00322500 [Synaphobranchus kaupii]